MGEEGEGREEARGKHEHVDKVYQAEATDDRGRDKLLATGSFREFGYLQPCKLYVSCGEQSRSGKLE